MSELNIVLIEPQIPQNTGNVARTCAATGARLHLVGPLGFELDDTKLKRAGLDYWHLLDISMYADSGEFFDRVPGPFFCYTTKAPRRHTDVSYPHGSFLLFGREDRGLPESLLASNMQTCVRIPMLREARSLNLSNSVAIAAYEALRQWDYPELSGAGRLTNYNWGNNRNV